MYDRELHAPDDYFFRVCVDLSISGEVLGSSFEVRRGGRLETFVVLPPPGPFESVADVAEATASEVTDRYGVRLKVF